MHEYSIVGALLEQVDEIAREKGAHKVHRLQLRIGKLAGIEVELLRTAFETFRERTICAGAELAIEEVAAKWGCPRCGGEIRPGGPLRCAECGGPAELQEGSEIFLDRIEMEAQHV